MATACSCTRARAPWPAPVVARACGGFFDYDRQKGFKDEWSGTKDPWPGYKDYYKRRE